MRIRSKFTGALKIIKITANTVQSGLHGFSNALSRSGETIHGTYGRRRRIFGTVSFVLGHADFILDGIGQFFHRVLIGIFARRQFIYRRPKSILIGIIIIFFQKIRQVLGGAFSLVGHFVRRLCGALIVDFL